MLIEMTGITHEFYSNEISVSLYGLKKQMQQYLCPSSWAPIWIAIALNVSSFTEAA